MKRAANALLGELQGFVYEISGADRVWNVLFPDRKEQWHHMRVNCYGKTSCITHINGETTLEVEPGKGVRINHFAGRPFGEIMTEEAWEQLMEAALRWLRAVNRDWIRANRRLQAEFPLRYRCGTVPHALIRATMPDIYRLDKALGKPLSSKMVKLVEDGFFNKADNTDVHSMTANDYFKYCRIAYVAGRRREDKVNTSFSGRKMYRLFADGRHEGLLDINPASKREFADWLDGKHPKRTHGGHPWEIKRGGNTTHIDLAVFRAPYRSDAFRVELRGESLGRMAETVRMFLAVHKSGRPISIADPETVCKRILAQDYIGIVPSYDSLHRADQQFSPDQDVFDVLHYDDFGRFKRRLAPFITWAPLPLCRPHGG